jgi:hypothetical protein
VTVPVQLIIAEDHTRNAADAYVPDPDICEADFGSSTQEVTLYFMLIDGDQDITLNSLTFAVGYDLGGPSAPAITSVSPGESSLEVDWSPSGSGDVQRYYIYCAEAGSSAPDDDPAAGGADSTGAGGTPATGGAQGTAGGRVPLGAAGVAGADPRVPLGTGGDVSSAGTSSGATVSEGGAASDTTVAVNPDCPTTELVPGELPTDDLNRCGSSAEASRATASGLQNNTNYAVAVSAVDELGNVGPLSEVRCGIPIEVDDFFEVYRDADGKGGGGFCSVSQRVERGLALLLLGSFGALCWRRRRRHA